MKLKKINFTAMKILFLKDIGIEKVLVSNKIYSGEKRTIDNVVVTSRMTIKLSHYR